MLFNNQVTGTSYALNQKLRTADFTIGFSFSGNGRMVVVVVVVVVVEMVGRGGDRNFPRKKKKMAAMKYAKVLTYRRGEFCFHSVMNGRAFALRSPRQTSRIQSHHVFINNSGLVRARTIDGVEFPCNLILTKRSGPLSSFRSDGTWSA